jgi:hypothetical protein
MNVNDETGGTTCLEKVRLNAWWYLGAVCLGMSFPYAIPLPYTSLLGFNVAAIAFFYLNGLQVRGETMKLSIKNLDTVRPAKIQVVLTHPIKRRTPS